MVNDYIKVGQIVNTSGIKGDVKVYPYTDFALERFAEGNKLYLGIEESPNMLTIEVESAKPYKQIYLVKFKGLNNINDAEKFRNYFLWITKKDQEELPDGEFYYHQIIGCKVVTTTGEELGTIKEILAPGANDVWVVRPVKKGKDILIPYIEPVVKQIDVEGKIVTIEILEGLLD